MIGITNSLRTLRLNQNKRLHYTILLLSTLILRNITRLRHNYAR